MKCVCRRRCQAKDSEGRVVTYKKGQVADFVVAPPHFDPLEGEDAVKINFDTASEDELMEAEYDLDSLKDYIRQKFGKNPANRGLTKTVEMLFDCKYRSIDNGKIQGMI